MELLKHLEKAAAVVIICVGFALTCFLSWVLKDCLGAWPSLISAIVVSMIIIAFAASVIVVGSNTRRGLITIILVYLTAVFALIFHFSIIYLHFGITSSNGQVKDLADAFYFSTVTWTTLGYGDIVPLPAARAFVVAQALLGQIMMALLVTVFVYGLGKRA